MVANSIPLLWWALPWATQTGSTSMEVHGTMSGHDLVSHCGTDFSGNEFPPLLSVRLCQPQRFWVIPVYCTKAQIISLYVSLYFVSWCAPVCLSGSVPLSFNKDSPSFNSIRALFIWLPHRSPANHPLCFADDKDTCTLDSWTPILCKLQVDCISSMSTSWPSEVLSFSSPPETPFASEERNAPQHVLSTLHSPQLCHFLKATEWIRNSAKNLMLLP